MCFEIEERSEATIEAQPLFDQVSDTKIIGETRWVWADGREEELFQVITVRAGKIVDLQDCSSRRKAERFAR